MLAINPTPAQARFKLMNIRFPDYYLSSPRQGELYLALCRPEEKPGTARGSTEGAEKPTIQLAQEPLRAPRI